MARQLSCRFPSNPCNISGNPDLCGPGMPHRSQLPQRLQVITRLSSYPGHRMSHDPPVAGEGRLWAFRAPCRSFPPHYRYQPSLGKVGPGCGIGYNCNISHIVYQIQEVLQAHPLATKPQVDMGMRWHRRLHLPHVRPWKKAGGVAGELPLLPILQYSSI